MTATTRFVHRALIGACRAFRAVGHPGIGPGIRPQFSPSFSRRRICRRRGLHLRISVAALVRTRTHALFRQDGAQGAPRFHRLGLGDHRSPDHPAGLYFLLLRRRSARAAALAAAALFQARALFGRHPHNGRGDGGGAQGAASPRAFSSSARCCFLQPPSTSPSKTPSRRISAPFPPPCGGRSSPSRPLDMATSRR